MYVSSQFAGMFRSHVIGGEPIAINEAQFENSIGKPNNTFCSTWESNSRPLA